MGKARVSILLPCAGTVTYQSPLAETAIVIIYLTVRGLRCVARRPERMGEKAGERVRVNEGFQIMRSVGYVVQIVA